jgi:hypothetical protein
MTSLSLVAQTEELDMGLAPHGDFPTNVGRAAKGRMETRGVLLKRAALSGALDDLPLDALRLYLLLIVWAEEVGRESRVCLQTIQRVLGPSFSRQACQRALTVLAAHDLLTWAPSMPRPSRRQRVQRGREGLEIVFQLNPLNSQHE